MNSAEFLRILVESSVLASIRYSKNMTLELEFRKGTIYRYFDVPPTIFRGLIAADSKGAFFNLHLRNHFRYQRLV